VSAWLSCPTPIFTLVSGNVGLVPELGSVLNELHSVLLTAKVCKTPIKTQRQVSDWLMRAEKIKSEGQGWRVSAPKWQMSLSPYLYRSNVVCGCKAQATFQRHFPWTLKRISFHIMIWFSISSHCDFFSSDVFLSNLLLLNFILNTSDTHPQTVIETMVLKAAVKFSNVVFLCDNGQFCISL